MENNRFRASEESFGGCLQGYVTCSYAELVSVFGEPDPRGSDGYKVSTEWNIEDTEEGRSFTLYDYKETNLYSPSLPTVQQFRNQRSYEWHIGGDPDFGAISRFLTKKLGRAVIASAG
jgi:hypothetical protein